MCVGGGVGGGGWKGRQQAAKKVQTNYLKLKKRKTRNLVTALSRFEEPNQGCLTTHTKYLAWTRLVLRIHKGLKYKQQKSQLLSACTGRRRRLLHRLWCHRSPKSIADNNQVLKSAASIRRQNGTAGALDKVLAGRSLGGERGREASTRLAKGNTKFPPI